MIFDTDKDQIGISKHNVTKSKYYEGALPISIPLIIDKKDNN